MTIKIKRRRRRTNFTPHLARIAVKAAERGIPDKRIAEVLGCAPATLSRWKAKRQNFGKAMAEAKNKAQIY
ncbi:MAG: helix-turn-helix domain-containing protein [Phormidesmis sp.]